MADDRLTTSLQESVLTLLATNSVQGRIASGLLTEKSFDASYQDFAGRILAYHRKQGKAPGVNHLDDLIDDVLGNPKHKLHRQYIRILDSISAAAEGINADYVLTRVSDFARRQDLKGAVLEAAERYQQGDENMVVDVETILHKALKFKDQGLDAGTFLNDRTKALGFLTSIQSGYMTGIPELDQRSIGPTPGEMLVFMGPKGSGKSWFCVEQGKRCLLQKAKVVHISLEMAEDRVVQRYFQNFFALPKRKTPFDVSSFARDEKTNKFEGLATYQIKPKMHLESRGIKRYLLEHIEEWGSKFGNLVVKSFPAKSLTISKLDAYLDNLELSHNFIPNVLIIDYPDLLWMDKKDPRISLGWTFEELRGLMQRRHLAGICPTQTNRRGWDAITVKGSMIAEDASKFNTADMIIIYSATEAERQRGLARLYIEKNRNDEGNFTVLITQNYRSGQFVLDSTRMSSEKAYFDMLSPPSDEEDDDE